MAALERIAANSSWMANKAGAELRLDRVAMRDWLRKRLIPACCWSRISFHAEMDQLEAWLNVTYPDQDPGTGLQTVS